MLLYPRRKDYKLHEEFIEHDCCAKCSHVFEWYEYDSQPYYYCHRDRSIRPKCMSVAMEEYVDWFKDKEACRIARETWDEWASKRQVEPYGWCPEYKEQ